MAKAVLVAAVVIPLLLVFINIGYTLVGMLEKDVGKLVVDVIAYGEKVFEAVKNGSVEDLENMNMSIEYELTYVNKSFVAILEEILSYRENVTELLKEVETR